MSKKNTVSKISIYYVLALFLYVFTFLIIPFKKVSMSWISFSFTIVALAISYLTTLLSFERKDLKSKFYGYPIFRIGILYVTIQLVLNIIFIILGIITKTPTWICWLFEVVLLILAISGVYTTKNIKDTINEIESQTKIDLKLMYKIKNNIVNVSYIETNESLKEEIEHLVEEIKYSDPVSSENTISLENELIEEIEKLKFQLESQKYEDAKHQIKLISNKVKNRNNICKTNKGN